jgi:ADP-ribosylglycohydrolase
MTTLPQDYPERAYAAVLGKLIGVYLGRPFEGWTYQRIMNELGPIEDYVHERLNCPLVVTDDDVAGTFTFIRALEDHGARADITAREIGETWLNYIVENRKRARSFTFRTPAACRDSWRLATAPRTSSLGMFSCEAPGSCKSATPVSSMSRLRC